MTTMYTNINDRWRTCELPAVFSYNVSNLCIARSSSLSSLLLLSDRPVEQQGRDISEVNAQSLWMRQCDHVFQN